MSTAGFRRVFAAEVVSTFGSLMSRLAIPWLAVLVLDAGPSAMALLAVADVAASAFAALLLGALVDRWPKRRTMIACDLARAAMLATVPLMATAGLLTIAWLVVVIAVNGALTVAFELAQSAWIARSTAHENLTGRNSALAAGTAATEAASFGLTGWLFQWLGAVVVMVLDALTYVVSAVLLVKIGEPPPLPAEASTDRSLRGRARALASECDFLVLDEAHTVPEVATNNFGLSLSSYSVDRALKHLFNPKSKRGLLRKHAGPEGQQLVLDALEASKQFFDHINTRLLDKRPVVRIREAGVAVAGGRR